MPIYTYDLLYLGNAADIDSDETDLEAEDAVDLLGTYGTNANPLANNIVSAVIDDADSDSSINTDNDFFAASETVTIDSIPKVMDSGVVYNATITYMDGTTATITAVVMQATDGDLYLFPELSANADAAAMEAKAIESLTLDSVLANPTTIAADRYQTNFVCFSQGTRILTETGPRPVETLRPGDRLVTKDHGLQPLRWVGSWVSGIGAQLRHPKSRPVQFSRGSLAPGIPARNLVLSPQHRVLLASKITNRMFGCYEVLAAARALAQAQFDTIHTIVRPVRYFHLLLDRHEILFAEGAAVESLFLGPETEKVMDTSVLDDLRENTAPGIAVRPPMEPARRVIGRSDVYKCIARHAKNQRPLCMADGIPPLPDHSRNGLASVL